MPFYARPCLDTPKFVSSLQNDEELLDAFEEDNIFGVEQRSDLMHELDQILEDKFDEAAVPEYQLIQTYDRKKLMMKKHKRKKRKEKMRIKLKWSGKL